MFLTIVTFIIILSVLVLVHEIFGIKKGETTYSLNWIPFGGFVKIKGESGEDKDDPDSFANKKIWQRCLILSNGVVMNFLLAVVLLSIGFLIGIPLSTDDLPGYAKVRDEKISIVEVAENYPAQEAGLKMGDALLSIDNQEFEEIKDVQNYIESKKSVIIKVERGGRELDKEISTTQEDDGRNVIGVALAKTGIVSFPWYLALWGGLKATFNLTLQIIIVLFFLFKKLFFQGTLISEVSGPVGVAVMTHTMVEMGFVYILQFAALISINLGIINFLPFPALDGGRVLFLILEKIRGKPVNQRVEAVIHNVGFIFLIFLMFLVTYRDFVRFGGKIWQKIIGG
ncbi:MAG: membrane-associated zinc metalloprotease [Parcubacteria group bacterium Athens0714_12]|nr:MAG: membrane-associated zinc metalloprotease [Parcubacteria group bacterium Athens0714_12]